MKFTVKIEKDLDGIRKLKKQVEVLNKRHVKFGWIDGAKYPPTHKNGGIPIAQVAHWQEYGVSQGERNPPIPARPYFRQTVNKVRYTYYDNIKEVFKASFRGDSVLPNLDKIAEGIVLNYTEQVARQNHKKLAARTVRNKGHSYQMMDSGYMTKNFKAKVYRIGIKDKEGK